MTARLVSGCLLSMGGGAWWFRPKGNSEFDVRGPRRDLVPTMSTRDVHDEATDIPVLWSLSQKFVTPIVVTFWRGVMSATGNVEILRDDNYDNFLNAVVNRGAAPLITISNHRSLMDDPIVMCNLLPLSISIKPQYLRWNICAQEYCFNDKFPSVIHAFLGAGRTLPIWRGGGNQKALHTFARKAALGDWLHLFPEAGIWQYVNYGLVMSRVMSRGIFLPSIVIIFHHY